MILNLYMETITININEETANKFRGAVKENLGLKKGMLSKAISEALQKWTEEIEQKNINQRSLEKLKKGYNMGKKMYKKREDLYF